MTSYTGVPIFVALAMVAGPLPARAAGAPAADTDQPTQGAPDDPPPPTEPGPEDPQPPSAAEGWDAPTTETQDPPATTSQPVSVPAPRLESPPAHEADVEQPEGRGAKIVMHTGLGLLSAGVATLLFVAVPSRFLKQRALERYESAESVYQRRAWLDRAYRRDLTMQISAGVGLGLLTAGASLAIGGAIARRSARSDMARRAGQLVLVPSHDGFTLPF